MTGKHKLQLLEFGIALIPALIPSISSCGGTSGLPYELKRFPADLGNAKLEASGIYGDGWTEKTVSVNLQQPAGKQVLSVRGTIPRIDVRDFNTEIVILLDNKEVGRRSVGLGDFKISAPVESGLGRRRVTVAFSALQQLPNGDARNVGAHLITLGFEGRQIRRRLYFIRYCPWSRRTPRERLGDAGDVSQRDLSLGRERCADLHHLGQTGPYRDIAAC
jgi:hypothetical protein